MKYITDEREWADFQAWRAARKQEGQVDWYQRPIAFAERLPQIGQDILVWYAPWQKWVMGGMWVTAGDVAKEQYSHWLPLPPAPEAQP